MSAARYSPVAAILHWTIAALIIGQIFGGMYMHGLPNSSPVKFDLYQLHKSFGLTVLALSLVRLGWRFTHKAPPLPAAMPGWQKFAAR
ncbi:MAG: cytochrome b/b6 domain-containing protein, partial [Oricola sp.]|nr:cytochrome b/b6 domain-containing protein [Oricola sp.]